jgi:hypothetical protein
VSQDCHEINLDRLIGSALDQQTARDPCQLSILGDFSISMKTPENISRSPNLTVFRIVITLFCDQFLYIRIWISPSTGKSPCALGESPFSHSALDIKTYAMALLKKDYRQSSKRNMPRRWFDDVPHTHVALDDAIEQGALFCNMLAENRIKEA